MNRQSRGVLFYYTVHLISILFFRQSNGFLTHGINGGISCSACTLILGVVGQLAEVNNATLVETAEKVCSYLPRLVQNSCQRAVEDLESIFADIVLSDKFTPDVICYGLKYCHVDPEKTYCHLFPAPEDFESAVRELQFVAGGAIGFNPCHLLGVGTLCKFLNTIFHGMKPVADLDGDLFSSVLEHARGIHWRGRDCRDWDADVYPGRKPKLADVDFDTDCNGILGLNEETDIPWETELCEPQKRESRGLIFIGDSIGAHFHFPEVWINPLLISKENAHNFTGAILDEMDWPHLSFATGFENSSTPHLIEGLTESVYMRLRERNLCNHRDYQNICRNGANSFDLSSYVDNIARKHEDKPALVMIGVFGNDVCNRFPDTLNHMTTPDEFYTNIKSALDKLASRLPEGSHVVLLGLTDGSFIYPVMSERIHPIGALHANVKYKNVYKWLECMETSPCVGWMSNNEETRNATLEAAKILSLVLKNIAETTKYKNITLHYLPDPLSLGIIYWKSTGGKLWEIIEAVDGLHPNQKAQPFIAKALWQLLQQNAPDAIGTTNQQNKKILEKFGDQGGH